jgi:hypothetical protein
LTNRPNSAGMGPGVYKTQSKHTKNKSPYPTGAKRHKESSLFLHTKCKSGERGKGVPVSSLYRKSINVKFANWPNSAGMVPGVYKSQSIYTKNKSPYPTGMLGHKESKPFPSY